MRESTGERDEAYHCRPGMKKDIGKLRDESRCVIDKIIAAQILCGNGGYEAKVSPPG